VVPFAFCLGERGEIVDMEQGLRGFILLVKIWRERGETRQEEEKKKVALGTEISRYYSVYPLDGLHKKARRRSWL
jgi:hypothetical protein